MSGPEPADHYANIYVPITAGVGAEGIHTADIRMSRHDTRQHVGQLAGQRMWDAIYKCLLDICPYERGRIGCYKGMPGAGTRKKDGESDSHKYYSECRIADVPYVNDKGEYTAHAWLTIKAEAIFRNDKYPGIGAATVSQVFIVTVLPTDKSQYEMAAGVYKQATENKANCYLQEFKYHSRTYEFCNVPRNVLVSFPTTGPVTDSWLSMTIEFNGKTAYGTFDCMGTKPSVNDFWETAVRPDIARIMSYPEGQWGTRTACEDNERCFSVDGWRECTWGI